MEEIPEDVVLRNMQSNEASRLLSAIQGHHNTKILAEGLNRLIKNYVRMFRSSLPSAKFYTIPFNIELALFIWRL